MAAKLFTGADVFMSRSLVPPELFDALHDALKFNGAQVFFICDPSRNGPNNYHIIASSDHEKFEYLRSKGCKLIGQYCKEGCSHGRTVDKSIIGCQFCYCEGCLCPKIKVGCKPTEKTSSHSRLA